MLNHCVHTTISKIPPTRQMARQHRQQNGEQNNAWLKRTVPMTHADVQENGEQNNARLKALVNIQEMERLMFSITVSV